jgi:hypothetical protein
MPRRGFFSSPPPEICGLIAVVEKATSRLPAGFLGNMRNQLQLTRRFPGVVAWPGNAASTQPRSPRARAECVLFGILIIENTSSAFPNVVYLYVFIGLRATAECKAPGKAPANTPCTEIDVDGTFSAIFRVRIL